MRYLLVDHITELEAGKSVKGIKNVAMTEDFLEFHFPGNPVMPGVMLLEALAQLTGWFNAVSTDFREWFVIEQIFKCNYYGFAFPGDQVELEVAVSGQGEDGGMLYLGSARVNGRKKVVVDFAGKNLPLGDLDDIDRKRKEYQVLTRSLTMR